MRPSAALLLAPAALSCVLALAPPRVLAAQLAPAPAPSDSAVDAVGIVRSPAPGRSVAILRSGGRTRVVGIGETAFGAKLTAVGADTVTLEIDGRPVERRVTRGQPLPATPAKAAPAAASPSAPAEDPATPAREMDRQQVQARIGQEMNRILAETAIAPVMEDGRVVGVQLTRVPEGSLLTDAGLRAGDVLTRINGTQIDGMATLIGLWPRLQGASELDAVVMRGGQPVSVRVTLR
jgi:type II secretion system protein C